ncbi:uncharacterized protein LOC131671706 [Phymastichus coffea]|uniref:uncharacterized protein LOC131671706 n=1 Tax=Phymastichus coffea TaxID=108790 RepID=UPI00273C0029|nr:uncharacterized protein LOC131671706 [Phymastichus coffea]
MTRNENPHTEYKLSVCKYQYKVETSSQANNRYLTGIKPGNICPFFSTQFNCDSVSTIRFCNYIRNIMQPKAMILLFVVASVLVMSELAAAKKSPNGYQCKRYNNCLSNCCANNKCVENANGCPCSNLNNPCNRKLQVCIPLQVQCIRAPCYPIAKCQPRFLSVTPTN